jgi:ornithine carbamoyltransferase
MIKDILSILDLTREDMDRLIERAIELKKNQKAGTSMKKPLEGKTLGLLFDKHSTRTRLSFEAAMVQLGGVPVYISSATTQIARNEPVRDTARVISRYLDALAIRTYSQELLEQFGAHADIPVINALTDLYHPCQVLSDLMTIVENKGSYDGLTVAWLGDGNNMAHSWINAASVAGFKLMLACPEPYFPDKAVLDKAVKMTSSDITLLTDPVKAVTGADVINTDVWASMGKDDELEERKKVFAPYQVNADLLNHADENAIVLHCLPAHRDEEITDEVLEGFRSVVWEQAENKMHMHKAILEALMGR